MSVIRFPTGHGGVTGPPSGGDEMEARIARLEQLAEKTSDRLGDIDVRLAKIDTRIESLATNADLSEAKNSIILWVVGAIFITQLLPMLPVILRAFKLIP